MRMTARRLESALILALLGLLAYHACGELFLAPGPRTGRIWQRGSDGGWASHFGTGFRAFLAVYKWAVTTAAVGRVAWIALAGLLAAAALRAESKQSTADPHARRGAGRGLLLGCLALPLLFGTVLQLHSTLSVIGPGATGLYWLSLCCSTMALTATTVGTSVSDRAGPGLTELFTATFLAHAALAVKDVLMFVTTVVCCLLFAYLLYFLLHTLRFSFTEGESVTAATLISLLLTHTTFSLISHGLAMRPYASWLLECLETAAHRAMLLEISLAHPSRRQMDQEEAQTVAFFNACMALIVGVIMIGVIWFGTVGLRYKRARTRRTKMILKEDRLLTERTRMEVATDAAEQALVELDEDLTTNASPVASNTLPPLKLKRRNIAAEADVDAVAAESQPLMKQSRRTRSSPSPAVATGSAPIESVSAVWVWMCLLVCIFCVVYPFIWLEMGVEPFTFVWRFLVAHPPSDDEWYRAEAARRMNGGDVDPTAMPPSLLYESLLSSRWRFQLWGNRIDLTFLAMNLRLTIAAIWGLLVVIAVFFCAPNGRTKGGQQAGQSLEQSLRQAVSSDLPAPVPAGEVVHTETVDVAPSNRLESGGAVFVPPVLVRFPMPLILVRKYYHFLAAALFLPGIILEPGFVALAFAVALSIFALCEYLRLARLPPVGDRMQKFMRSYLDSRDSGIVVLTHAYLLLGCALPLWLHLHVLAADDPSILRPQFESGLHFMQALNRAGDRRMRNPALVYDFGLYLPALAGTLILGIGDSMASLIGVWFGRTRWFGGSSGRTVEGTVAAVVSIMACTYGLVFATEVANTAFYGGHLIIVHPAWLRFLASTVATCLLEASTSQIDNLFLPIVYYATMLLIGT